jgi:hypothetical protein
MSTNILMAAILLVSILDLVERYRIKRIVKESHEAMVAEYELRRKEQLLSCKESRDGREH